MTRTVIITLALLALPGSARAQVPPSVSDSEIKAALARAVAPLRIRQLYWSECRARQVGTLQRQADRLAWRVTLSTMSPFSKRTLHQQMADCRMASQLNDQASAARTAARAATLDKARARGIPVSRGLLQSWGMHP